MNKTIVEKMNSQVEHWLDELGTLEFGSEEYEHCVKYVDIFTSRLEEDKKLEEAITKRHQEDAQFEDKMRLAEIENKIKVVQLKHDINSSSRNAVIAREQLFVDFVKSGTMIARDVLTERAKRELFTELVSVIIKMEGAGEYLTGSSLSKVIKGKLSDLVFKGM